MDIYKKNGVKDCKARRGFTLVELLVVIAVISLLLSVMLPALQKVRSQANSLLCMTRMRSLSNASMTYANDYDGHYPLAGSRSHNDRLSNWGGGYPVAPFWDARVLRYIYPELREVRPSRNSSYYLKGLSEKPFENLYCPGISGMPEYARAFEEIKSGRGNPNNFPRSYRINGMITGHAQPSGEFRDYNQNAYKNSLNTAQVQNASSTLLFVESDLLTTTQCYNSINGWAARDWYDVRPGHFVKRTGTPPSGNPWGLSAMTGRANIICADGHSDTITRAFTGDTWQSDSSKTYWEDGEPENTGSYKFFAQ